MSVSMPEVVERDFEFDEAWYLKAYPDIARAVKDGKIESGLAHYVKFGRKAGRLPTPFDPTWYSRAYPLVVREAGSTDAAALRRHYASTGRFRGYRPHPSIARPKNSAQIPSPFGGLWIDGANARDLIDGKFDIGRIDSAEASQLHSYLTNGYVKLSGLIKPSVVDRAEEALERAYSGKIDNLLFDCQAIAKTYCAWGPATRSSPAKALDIHWWSEEIRDIILCDPVTSFLHLVFERPALVSQSLGFFRGSGQPLHQDSAYVPYSLPLQFMASWIALEDVAVGAGELEYLAGSHKALPEYVYPGGHRNVSESQRYGTDKAEVSAAVKTHEGQIASEGKRLGLKRESFIAKRGDALFWHADLAHGGAPISLSRSRKSVVTHYCPQEVAPLYFENMAPVIRRHGRHGYYTSRLYQK